MAEIRVPTLGESVTEATVATWFKKVGDAVKVDEMLCELETDKVTVEVPATAAGVLAEIVAKEGETVGVDALLATIDEKAAGKPPPPAPKPAGAPRPGARRRRSPARPPAPTPSRRRPTSSRSRSWCRPSARASPRRPSPTWFKKVGDAVTQDEMLCELETDKVSVEVPAPASGTLAEIYAGDGATVAAGGKLGRIGGGARGRRRRGRHRRRRRPGRRGPGRRPCAPRRRERAVGQQADGRPRPRPPTRSTAPAATAAS